jgi:alkylation response protein AidB-like acyl-CoA dehydrogenase
MEQLSKDLPAIFDEARARSVEFEERRAISPDYADKLKAINLFNILVPESAGGLGGSLPAWFEVMTQLAEADASTAWVTAHSNYCSASIYACCDPRFCDEFFSDPNACAAWSNMPNVEVEELDSGLRISGSWSFESGCTLATYVGGMVMLPPETSDGPPRGVVAFAPVAQAEVREVWDPIGLAGSGSHDVCFDGIVVPWQRTFPWPATIPICEYPNAVLAPGAWFVSLCAAATHLGLARRALDEARVGLEGKIDRYTQKPTLEHPAVLRSLETAEGMWFACRAGVREAIAELWECGLRGEVATEKARVDARVAAVTAVHRGAEVVRTAYEVAGASAILRKGTLQRLLREASCLTQHISSNQNSLELTGRVRCGIDQLTWRI